MLTNYDIIDECKRLKIPLVGVYSKDRLEKRHRRHGCYVINLQDFTDSQGNRLGGTHWTSFVLLKENGKNHCAYFDSFGFVPPNNVEKFLEDLRPYLVSDKHIQNINSGVCGSYCLFFMWYMTNKTNIPFKERFKRFLNLFSDDVTENRRILEKLIKPL
jgi:hypothetical protein